MQKVHRHHHAIVQTLAPVPCFLWLYILSLLSSTFKHRSLPTALVAKFSSLGKWSIIESVSVLANSNCELGWGSLENTRQAVYFSSPSSMTCYVICSTFDVLLCPDSLTQEPPFHRSTALDFSSSSITLIFLPFKTMPFSSQGVTDAQT